MCIKNVESQIRDKFSRQERELYKDIIDFMLNMFKEELRKNYAPVKMYEAQIQVNDRIFEEIKQLKKEVKGYRKLYKDIRFK